MVSNYIKIAFKNILRHKGYSFTGIMGLAIGMACSIFILLYVQFEVSYDMYHNDSKRIYRIALEHWDKNYGANNFALTPGILAPTLIQDFPEVVQAVRIEWKEALVMHNSKKHYDDVYLLADPSIFQVFSIPVISGDPSTALNNPNSIVITKETAKKYFKSNDPIGNVLKINDHDYIISGVIEDPPNNTHLRYHIIGSIISSGNGSMNPRWDRLDYYTYVKLNSSNIYKNFERKIHNLTHIHYGNKIKNEEETYYYFLQPITKIHLHSNIIYEISKNGNVIYPLILLTVCILILIIACINFVNLTTVRVCKRSQEIWLRRVVGSTQQQLISLFLVETSLMISIAVLVALSIVYYLLPVFNSLTGIHFVINNLLEVDLLLSYFILVIIIIFGAGSYPAMLLSALRPALLFKNTQNISSNKSITRKTLVVGQFTISIILMIGTIAIYKQLHYLKRMDLGFDKSQKLILHVKDSEYLSQHFEAVKNEFISHPSISGATVLPIPPAIWVRYWQMLFNYGDNKLRTQILSVDYDFIKEYGIIMVAGRSFDPDISTDGENGIILNRAAVEAFGFKSPKDAINKRILKYKGGHHSQIPDELNIVGICEDFHYYELTSKILPMMLILNFEYFNYISLTLESGNITKQLSSIEKKWTQLFPADPFDYYLLEDKINAQFRTEVQLGKILGIFTGIGFFIACLGLFGLAAFTSEQRIKEIGIRKVFGSKVTKLVFLLIRDFSKWILLANLFAWPIAYFAILKWMQNFEYQTKIQVYIYVFVSVFAYLIALIMIGFQTIKAALTNPVDILKYE